MSAFEPHDATVEGPFLHGDDRFALNSGADAAMNENGDRIKSA
ncbi:MAG: hypothetical protein WD969_06115 [Paracoccaceae bacterium]